MSLGSLKYFQRAAHDRKTAIVGGANEVLTYRGMQYREIVECDAGESGRYRGRPRAASSVGVGERLYLLWEQPFEERWSLDFNAAAQIIYRLTTEAKRP